MVLAAALLAVTFISVPAAADSFTLDGRMTGDSYSIVYSDDVFWYNGHSLNKDSIYGDPGSPGYTTTVYWGFGKLDDGDGNLSANDYDIARIPV